MNILKMMFVVFSVITLIVKTWFEKMISKDQTIKSFGEMTSSFEEDVIQWSLVFQDHIPLKLGSWMFNALYHNILFKNLQNVHSTLRFISTIVNKKYISNEEIFINNLKEELENICSRYFDKKQPRSISRRIRYMHGMIITKNQIIKLKEEGKDAYLAQMRYHKYAMRLLSLNNR